MRQSNGQEHFRYFPPTPPLPPSRQAPLTYVHLSSGNQPRTCQKQQTNFIFFSVLNLSIELRNGVPIRLRDNSGMHSRSVAGRVDPGQAYGVSTKSLRAVVSRFWLSRLHVLRFDSLSRRSVLERVVEVKFFYVDFSVSVCVVSVRFLCARKVEPLLHRWALVFCTGSRCCFFF